jgi:hypothetical protein
MFFHLVGETSTSEYRWYHEPSRPMDEGGFFILVEKSEKNG